MLLFTKLSNVEAAVINLLKYLKVNINPDTVIAELEKHPDYPSMLAVSDVLTHLNIENSAFRTEFEMLNELPCPFLVNLNSNGGEFAVVTKMDDKQVYFSDERKTINKLSLKDFKLTFGGVVLVAEPGDNLVNSSSWPANVNKLKPLLTALGLFSVLLILIYINGYFSDMSWTILTLSCFKTAGLLVSVVLLIQSIDSNNPLVQVLCRDGGKTDCNAILSSKAAQLFEGLTWSEVGFFYFGGTWLLLLFGGRSATVLTILAVFNLISLPYTFYSIYYQARIAKKWCVLCCTIQALLWLEFVPLIRSAFTTGFYLKGNISSVLLLTIICLLTPCLIWFALKPLFLKLQQLTPLKDQLRKFKYNSELFNQVLTAQPQYNQPDKNWSIVLGNTEATNVITMVSNPYCPPCAKMHQMLDELIEENSDIQARIVFTAQNTEADRQTPVTRHLMALNALPDKSYVKHALHDWYKQKQKSYDAWAKAHPVKLEEKDYYKLDEQKAWCRMAEVAATPTMLINGYILPAIYQLPDLKYMLQ